MKQLTSLLFAVFVLGACSAPEATKEKKDNAKQERVVRDIFERGPSYK